MLRGRFPRPRIAREQLAGEQRDDAPTLDRAIEQDVQPLHGSAPSIVCPTVNQQRREAPIKPYGIVRGTISNINVGTRETRSLDLVREHGLDGRFVPEATLALDLRDEPAADRLLDEHGLEPGRFACFVPRLRWTPYWEMRPGTVREEQIRERSAVN